MVARRHNLQVTADYYALATSDHARAAKCAASGVGEAAAQAANTR